MKEVESNISNPIPLYNYATGRANRGSHVIVYECIILCFALSRVKVQKKKRSESGNFFGKIKERKEGTRESGDVKGSSIEERPVKENTRFWIDLHKRGLFGEQQREGVFVNIERQDSQGESGDWRKTSGCGALHQDTIPYSRVGPGWPCLSSHFTSLSSLQSLRMKLKGG